MNSPLTCYSQEISQGKLTRPDQTTIQRNILANVESRFTRLITRSQNQSYTSSTRTKLKHKYVKKQENFGVVHFYFKELGLVKYSRDELYGIMDVIGMCPHSK